MKIEEPLFVSKHVCLAPIDHDQDPEIESRWTHDGEYLQLVSMEPARPLSPAQLREKYEKIEKEIEESKSLYYFTIRMRTDDRLIGFSKLYWIEWSSGTGFVELGIGDEGDRCKGFGTEALNMLLRYAFAELNLHRLTALVPDYNIAAKRLFGKCGFVEEVRRRQALDRFGQRWDLLHLGILSREWFKANN